jgi:hypothetical protein
VQFRWVAFIALWTAFVGPILATPYGRTMHPRRPPAPAVKTIQHKNGTRSARDVKRAETVVQQTSPQLHR